MNPYTNIIFRAKEVLLLKLNRIYQYVDSVKSSANFTLEGLTNEGIVQNTALHKSENVNFLSYFSVLFIWHCLELVQGKYLSNVIRERERGRVREREGEKQK